MNRHALGSSAVAAILGLGLVGCENGTGTYDQTTQPQKLGQMSSETPINAPDINIYMEQFDANIGDTATGVGGGGANQQSK